MQNNAKILMIGPDKDFQGGISSLINMYYHNNLYNGRVIYLPSYMSKNIFIQCFFYLFFIFQYIFQLIIIKNIKLIHIHTASRGSFFRKSFVCMLAKLFNKKIILHLHGAEFDLFYKNSSKFIKEIITNTFNKSDLIIVLSKQWKDKILEICSNPNIEILYTPAIIKEICPHVEKEELKIVATGRLSKRKGTYDIIEAARYIKNDKVKIDLYGDGNIKEFKTLISKNNLQQKITVKGWTTNEEKELGLKKADLLVLPSYNEGLPMSILEAMAYGKPIISTPVGGIPEAVEDGVNGFLIQPGDYKALAEKIDLLTNDNKLREKMGQESYIIAKEKFDIKVISKQLEGIYDSLLK